MYLVEAMSAQFQIGTWDAGTFRNAVEIARAIKSKHGHLRAFDIIVCNPDKADPDFDADPWVSQGLTELEWQTLEEAGVL
jgi:hypothetical protein